MFVFCLSDIVISRCDYSIASMREKPFGQADETNYSDLTKTSFLNREVVREKQ